MTNKPLIVLLSGWAGSGKDAAASLLVEEMQFDRVAFADALKEDVSRATSIPIHYFNEVSYKDTPLQGIRKTPRDLLLEHALAARAEDPDIYSRRIAARIRPLSSALQHIVVSDWRYTREYEFMKKNLDAHIVRGRILRSLITPSSDPSEHDLDNEIFDFTIVNDGCISDLRDALKHVIRDIKQSMTATRFIV